MNRGLLIAFAGLLACTACRKKPKTGTPADGGVQAVQPGELPAPVASKAADPSAAAPLPPPDAEITVAVERRFIPAKTMNAYSPAQAGDYQAQLNLYNRVLRKWTAAMGFTPATMKELMGSSGTPKPPQPPSGRTLVYDQKTVTVSLQ